MEIQSYSAFFTRKCRNARKPKINMSRALLGQSCPIRRSGIDAFPTSLPKRCSCVLAPTVTCIVQLGLSVGYLCPQLKQSIIAPSFSIYPLRTTSVISLPPSLHKLLNLHLKLLVFLHPANHTFQYAVEQTSAFSPDYTSTRVLHCVLFACK